MFINEIRNSWKNLIAEASRKRISYRVFLMNAEATSLEENILTITYNQKFSYAKEQMETSEYSEEFLKITREFFNEDNLNIQYSLTGPKINRESGDSEFHKKVKDFFEGNIS